LGEQGERGITCTRFRTLNFPALSLRSHCFVTLVPRQNHFDSMSFPCVVFCVLVPCVVSHVLVSRVGSGSM